ncbi:MAG: hypothetical protein OHK93_001796 [Ramalina farinacea]|uniref:Major facilitator superfamily (MFS) profile domain-containing protein n=1 Tax=Ramalina farinacea TaxID=258253 RepID=A0AA43TZT6_9LECA|nr:hypothetical protein [Ramalina farinacea]
MDLNKGDTTYVTDKSIHSQATSKNSGLDYFEPNDRAAEKRLLRKLDLRVVPIIAFLYTLAFLDRINIGNARIQGLEKDLHMKGQDFNIALMIFFIPYILFEVPSNLIVRKIAPSTWLSTIMVLWGIVTICQGVTASFGGLIACRFFLGLCEAGFFPGKIKPTSSSLLVRAG